MLSIQDCTGPSDRLSRQPQPKRYLIETVPVSYRPRKPLPAHNPETFVRAESPRTHGHLIVTRASPYFNGSAPEVSRAYSGHFRMTRLMSDACANEHELVAAQPDVP